MGVVRGARVLFVGVRTILGVLSFLREFSKLCKICEFSKMREFWETHSAIAAWGLAANWSSDSEKQIVTAGGRSE